MSPKPSTFKDAQLAKEYRKLHGNLPLAHENRAMKALIERIQRRGHLTLYQLKYWFPDRLSSAAMTLQPGQALALQQLYDCEFACDLVIDLCNGRSFFLATRGCNGAAISDELCHYLCSPNFLVLPGFHTHDKLDNELGVRKPSVADFIAIGCQQHDMGSLRLRHTLKSSTAKACRGFETSRWWLHRWKQKPEKHKTERGYPFVSPHGTEEYLSLLAQCLHTFHARVYFPDKEFICYALRWKGPGFIRQGVGRAWKSAW